MAVASPQPSPTLSEASSDFGGFSESDNDYDAQAEATLTALNDLGTQAEYLATNGPNAPPPTDQTFTSLEHGVEYLQQWGRDHGYGLITRNSRRDPGPVIDGVKPPQYEIWLHCELGGTKRTNTRNVASRNKRREKSSKKVNCTFKLKLSRPIRKPDEVRTITIGNPHHTCEAANRPGRAHRRRDRRAVADEIKTLRDESNMKAKDIYQAINAKHAAVTLKDIRNELQKLRDQTNKGYPVIQAMMRGLINDERWLFNYCYDDANRLERVVFFNKELVKLLTLFPSVLILDATYKTNRFNLPLINICTMTATNETLLIGQAFITHEEIGDYEWVLQFYKKLCDQQVIPYPKTIISDKAGGMLGAVPLVFPEAYHMLCIWHINKDVEAHCLKLWRRESNELVYDKQQVYAQEK
jgi:hypothetical protein